MWRVGSCDSISSLLCFFYYNTFKKIAYINKYKINQMGFDKCDFKINEFIILHVDENISEINKQKPLLKMH